MKKRSVALLMAVIMLFGVTVGATIAYLTSTSAVVKNTFEVGEVKITLDEAPVDEYGVVVSGERRTTNKYKLIPGHNYVKDPTVHVDADSEDCYLFIRINNEISGIEATGDTTIAAQMEANGWTDANGNGIYVYKEIVKAGDNVPVFGTFKLADGAVVTGHASSEIVIIACAVQADTLDATQAEAAVPAEFTSAVL